MASYREAVAFLESFVNYERNRGLMKYNTRSLHLRKFERFLRRIGSPQRAYSIVHIAGTKGKGSTAAVLHSIAVEAGIRSGLYTSPHLESYCERVRVDRKPISKRHFAEAVESLRGRLAADADRLETTYRTTFELLTALAFEVFRDEGVGLAIVETGLGGRLDATNVVSPEVSVITPVGLDHTHLLGTTPRAVAREKAGIVKPGRPVVVARQPRGSAGEILEVVGKVCRKRSSPLLYAPHLVEIADRRGAEGGQVVRLRWKRRPGGVEVFLPLLGPHQAENLRTALAVVEVLRRAGWAIGDEAIARGVSRVSWPGRVELLDGEVPLLLDGAHCELSAGALAETLCDRFSAMRPVFLFSLLAGKPVERVVRPIARVFRAGRFIVFRAPGPRGCRAAELVGPLKSLGLEVETARGPLGALRRALNPASRGTLLVAFGTLYSVEPLRKAYRKLTGR